MFLILQKLYQNIKTIKNIKDISTNAERYNGKQIMEIHSLSCKKPEQILISDKNYHLMIIWNVLYWFVSQVVSLM